MKNIFVLLTLISLSPAVASANPTITCKKRLATGNWTNSFSGRDFYVDVIWKNGKEVSVNPTLFRNYGPQEIAYAECVKYLKEVGCKVGEWIPTQYADFAAARLWDEPGYTPYYEKSNPEPFKSLVLCEKHRYQQAIETVEQSKWDSNDIFK